MELIDLIRDKYRKARNVARNIADDFNVGLNQNTIPSKIVKGAGEYLASGAKRFGASLGEAAYSPFYANQQRKSNLQATQEQRNLSARLKNASPTSKQRLLGAMKGYKTDFYNPNRDLRVLNKSNAQILGEAGQTAVDALGVGELKGVKALKFAKPTTRLLASTLGRGVEGAGYGALNALSQGGGKEDIIRGAKIGGALGGTLGFLSGSPIKALKYQNIASSMDAPIPSKYSEVQGANLYKPNVKKVVEDIKDFAVKELGFDPNVNNYQLEGKVTKVLDPDTGKLISWSTDNPNFARSVQEGKLTMGMSTRNVKPSEDALSNEAEIKRVAGNIIKNNKGTSQVDAEAMARDVIANRGLSPQSTPALSNEARKIPKELQPLVSEMKKYKTEEDMLRAFQGRTPDDVALHNAGLETLNKQLGRIQSMRDEALSAKAKELGRPFTKQEVDTGIAAEIWNKYEKMMSPTKKEISRIEKLGQTPIADKLNALRQNFTDEQWAEFTKENNLGDIRELYRSLSPQSTPALSNETKGIKPQLTPKNATEGAVRVNKGQLNTSNFNLSKKAQQNLDETVNAIKPELERVKGGVLKNEDVVDAAKASKILSREVDPNKTKQATAAVTRLRQEVAAGAEGKGLTKDFIENLKVLKSYSADAGRKLQAFNIQASPETSIKENVIADLIGLGKKSDELIAAAKGVDFDNPKQVTDFYRKFVKPSFGDVLNEYRYINLLSSPQTHIVNAFSNLVQGMVVSPATKLYSGAIDTIASGLTGKDRTAYVGEVPAYTKGFVNSIGEAFRQASDVFKGNKFVERPDMNRLPTGKLGAGEYITRALEASDIFFRTMIKGGELESLAYKAAKSGKKVPTSLLEKQAADKAEYFVFRKALDPSNKTGQGTVLSAIDKMTEAAYKLRKVPGVNWIIPFVQTPMNILKQGIEYSPLGVSTLAGNTNKTEQLAKSLLGSTVMAGAGILAMQGDSTWAAPTGKKEKEEFYATGRKPYSIKIGDNWVSYSKLGPLAYPIAMAAAVKYHFQQDSKASSTDSIDKATKMLGGLAGFFADQSYLTGIGDLLDIARGDQYAIKSTLSNLARQTVPLTSLQGWVARQIDPVYREAKTFGDQLKSGIPLLSKSVPAYTDPLGNPSVRKNNTFNSFSPINVNPADQTFEPIYQKTLQDKKANAELQAMKDTKSQGGTLSNGKIAINIDNEIKTFNTREEADLAVKGNEFVKSGKATQIVGDNVFKKADTDKGYTIQPKIQYDADLMEAKKTSLKNRKDVKGWLDNADKLYRNYQQQLQDPTLDDVEKLKIQNKIDSLLADAEKYAGYGGFKKPKKAKKISLNLSRVVPKGRPTLRTISRPNINIKTISQGGNSGRVATTGQPRSLRVKRMA